MYKQILYACDFTTESMVLAKKALKLAEIFNGTLYLVHVLELPIMYAHTFSEMDKVMADQKQHAKLIFNKFSEHLHIPSKQCFLLIGSPASQVLEQAEKLKIDLILVGSRGVGGYTHLLGSTAQSILHEAPCDVLTLNTDNIDPKLLKEDAIYYARKTTIGSTYQQEGLEHGKKGKSLKEEAPSAEPGPSLYGSKRGIKQAIKGGPRPGKRPKETPYGRTEREEDDDQETP